MKKTILLMTVLFMSITNLTFAKIKADDKFAKIKLTTENGQSKNGKVKLPFNLEKNIEVISEDGKTEKIPSIEIKTLEIFFVDGTSISCENVYYYESIRRKKIEKKPRLMMVILKGPITLYFDSRENITHMTTIGLTGTSTYANYYAKRNGEPAASLLSAVASGQANPNNVFKYAAPDYFEDYPELVKKINDKVSQPSESFFKNLNFLC